MGSHIDVFFPHDVEQTVDAVQARLEPTFRDLTDDLALIRSKGRFSKDIGDWSLRFEEGYVCGEGPSGLLISVYSAVVQLTSLERFGAVARPDQGIQDSLRRVFEATANAFGARGRLAVAGGGFGETDLAGDLAFEGASFDEIARALEKTFGHAGARTWEAVDGNTAYWYLSNPPTKPREA